jgi:hypothetical protein
MNTPEKLVLLHTTLAFAMPADAGLDEVFDSANMALVPLQRCEGGTNLIDYAFDGEPVVSPTPVEAWTLATGFTAPAPRYEVLTAIGNGWESVWTQDDKPQTFASPCEALAGLLGHIAGLIESSMDFNPCDFKIEPVGGAA